MQLTHPELLWGLLLLLIPILVHLLRLRRFRKTQFTNVKMLQRILAESNKTSQLKRWLLLLSRLGLLAALVLAFCQPFKSTYNNEIENDIVVYLDNSFSMQARWANTNLLQHAIQEMLQYFPEDLTFSLLTGAETYPNVRIRDIQPRLLDLSFSAASIPTEEIQFRVESLFSKTDSAHRQLWVFSDFMNWGEGTWEDWEQARAKAVHFIPESTANVAIDTAYTLITNPDNKELVVRLRATGDTQNPPVSLYNGDTLIAKTGWESTPEGILEARFTLPETLDLNGTIQISDEGLSYDNLLYVTINKPKKIEVLSIGPTASTFLGRIFTPETFNLKESKLRELDYSILESQHLILLNELAAVPPTLANRLLTYMEEGGSLVVIPAFDSEVTTYAPLLQSYGTGYGKRVDADNLITELNFDHPLFRDVFEKRIENFEYPQVGAFFPLEGTLSQVIGFQDGQTFLAGRERLYLFASPLSGVYSNFRNSPLIVPALYSIGKRSLPRADLYYQIGDQAQLEIDISLQEDEILELRNPAYSFIPRQQSFSRKTRLLFKDEPETAGNFRIENRGQFIQNVSFNYSRAETVFASEQATVPDSFEAYPGIGELVSEFQNNNRITSLWKWFVILALLFVLAELIIQKTMR